MIPLQVHITAGPTEGQRLQLNSSPITFGRAPDNALILDLPVVSRNHGELRFEAGEWLLVNHSQNGTRLGRKKVTTKPRPLTDKSSIIIGDEEVFRVSFVPIATESGDDFDDEKADDDAAGSAPKGRSKLWIGLGIWLAFCIGLFVFFATLTSGDDDNNGPGQTSRGLMELTSPDQVRDIISVELPSATPEESMYSANLRDARRAYTRGNITDMYKAYNSYRQAQRYIGNNQRLDPVDQQQLKDAEDRLTEEIYESYRTAYRLLQAGQYPQAINKVEELREVYPNTDNQNPLVRSMLRIREIASRRVR